VRILEDVKGKNLHISMEPEEVRTALDELSSKGLYISTWCKTEEDAGDLLGCISGWSKVR